MQPGRARFLAPSDPAAAERVLVPFVRSYVAEAGVEGVVLGLSGGVDSAVVAALAARALGPDRVLALVLPHRESAPEDAADAARVAAALGLAPETADVTPVVDAVLAAALRHGPSPIARANAKARARMAVLYAHANTLGRLVLGTGNKSELMQGYFTKYGDGAADLYPIGDLYKTDVWALARHLGVPEEVVRKPPSAGLWAGQTDEEELGMPYATLDEVLAGLEAGHAADVVAERLGLPEATARLVEARLLATEHKRASLVVPKLGFRTPGLDWRLPRQARRP